MKHRGQVQAASSACVSAARLMQLLAANSVVTCDVVSGIAMWWRGDHV